MVKRVISTSEKSQENIAVGFAVPFWFDNKTREIPEVTDFKGTKPLIFHILEELNNIENGYIVIMAYRNTAKGNNSTIELVKDEIKYASLNTPNVRVIVGQEFTKIEPRSATFWGTTKKHFEKEKRYIESEYSESLVFNGIAVHGLNDFINLDN